jgi:hypothetical protein
VSQPQSQVEKKRLQAGPTRARLIPTVHDETDADSFDADFVSAAGGEQTRQV